MSNYTEDGLKGKNAFDTSNASGIAKLLLLFLWVLLKKLLKFLLKCVILFFYKLYKGTKWCISWWTDDDTKEKRAELYTGIKKISLQFWKWTRVVAALLASGVMLFFKVLVNGIIHTRTTLKRCLATIKRWLIIAKETDYKTIFREKKAFMAKSINDFVSEKNDEEDKQTEEELLRELEQQTKKKNNAFEDAMEKLTKYLS